MVTNYKRGYSFERRVRKFYEGAGHAVIRSAGSKTPVDLVVINRTARVILMVQCKAKHISENEKEKLKKELETFMQNGGGAAFRVYYEVMAKR